MTERRLYAGNEEDQRLAAAMLEHGMIPQAEPPRAEPAAPKGGGLVKLTENSLDGSYECVRRPLKPLTLQAAPPLPPAEADTEVLLNGLIEECRFLMREVAFHSARLTPSADDRVRFLSAAESLALTSGKLADSIARLRLGTKDGEKRHRLIFEHAPPPPGDTP